MTNLQEFDRTVASLETLTAKILGSRQGFIPLSKTQKEDLAKRLQKVLAHLLFSNGTNKGEISFSSYPRGGV